MPVVTCFGVMPPNAESGFEPRRSRHLFQDRYRLLPDNSTGSMTIQLILAGLLCGRFHAQAELRVPAFTAYLDPDPDGALFNLKSRRNAASVHLAYPTTNHRYFQP
jgi:hypothetical protein